MLPEAAHACMCRSLHSLPDERRPEACRWQNARGLTALGNDSYISPLHARRASAVLNFRMRSDIRRFHLRTYALPAYNIGGCRRIPALLQHERQRAHKRAGELADAKRNHTARLTDGEIHSAFQGGACEDDRGAEEPML